MKLQKALLFTARGSKLTVSMCMAVIKRLLTSKKLYLNLYSFPALEIGRTIKITASIWYTP